MKRIQTINRAVDKFGSGKDGFNASVPGVQDATYLSADFLNGVQEAIVRVVERAGLTPSDSYDQLGDAIVAVTSSQVTLAAAVAVAARDIALQYAGATVTKDTQAALFADLAYANNTLGGVYRDSVVVNNGVYQKVGASGAGSWVQVGASLGQMNRNEQRDRLELLESTQLASQIIGTTAPATGSALASASTYLIAQPVVAPGYVASATVYGMAAGTIKIKRFTLSGGVFTLVSEVSMAFGVGLNTLDAWSLFSRLDLQPGDYLGLFCSSGSIAFIATALNSTPYYDPAGDSSGFAAGTLRTANALQVKFNLVVNRDPARGEARGRLALVEAESLTSQSIGTAAPVTGLELSNGPTYIISAPVLAAGYLRQLVLFGMVAGVVKVKRFTRVGSNFTFVAETAVPFAAGLNTLNAWQDFAALSLAAGDYLGFFFTSGKGAFAITANNTPYYAPAGDIVTSAAGGTLATGNRLAVGVTLTAGVFPIAAVKSEYRRRLDLLGSTTIAAQTVGTAVPVDGASLSVNRTYVVDVAIANPGYLQQIVLRGYTAGVIKIKRFTRSGLNFAFVSETSMPFAAGLNTLNAFDVFATLDLQPGDYLGFFVVAGAISVTVGVANNTPYYSPLDDVVAPFVADTLSTSNRLEIAFIAAGKIPDISAQGTVLVLPPRLYFEEGREGSVYFENIIPDAPEDYLWDMVGDTLGQQQNERVRWFPAGAIGATAVTVSAYDKRGNLVVSGGTEIVAAAASAGSGVTRTAIYVGDSLTQAGVITQTLLDRNAGDSFTVALAGTCGTAPNKHEGRGGYSVDDYTTAGRTYYKFTVSGVVAAPALNAAQYSTGTTNLTVQEVALSGGAGTITCSVDSGPAPAASGTLAKTNGAAGDAAIAFSASSAVSGNPFWNGSGVSFANYLTTNGIAAPNYVFIQLGTNDVFGQTSDAGATNAAISALAKLDVLVSSILAASAGIKVVIVPPPPPSKFQDSFGANYGTGQTRWRTKRNLALWNSKLIEHYRGQEAGRIYICPAYCTIDTVNNMQLGAAAAVNARSAAQVQRQINGVHPATSGYLQLGDAIRAFMKFLA